MVEIEGNKESLLPSKYKYLLLFCLVIVPICGTGSDSQCAPENSVLPKLIVTEVGRVIHLQCEKCLDNSKKKKGFDMQWKWMPFISRVKHWKYITGTENNENVFISPEQSLFIENARTIFSGLYHCINYNGLVSAAYRVDVVNQTQVHAGKNLQQTLRLTKHNVFIFTSWSSWSSCNRCNFRGQRKRTGTCHVRLIQQNDKENSNMLTHYIDGIPCKSSALPTGIKRLNVVKKRRNEIDWEYCFEACPTQPPILYITDSDQNVIEVVETGKGYLSIKGDKPEFSPKTKRKTIYKKVGHALWLECPYDKEKYQVVQSIRWQNGSQLIDPITIGKQSNDRVVIDISDRIEITEAKFTDSGIYSCWKKDYHVATIKLRIIENINISNTKTHTYIVIAIVAIISLGILLMLCTIYKKQRTNSVRYQ